jgi:hypothetical protein
MPTTTLDWPLSGRHRHIVHSLGCSNAPDTLRRLAAPIDEAAGPARWISQGSDR